MKLWKESINAAHTHTHTQIHTSHKFIKFLNNKNQKKNYQKSFSKKIINSSWS